MAASTLVMGAVAYAPKVVTIWEGSKAWFAQQALDFDYVLYSNDEARVEAQVDGRLHLAWNSPLAWVRADRIARSRGLAGQAVAMRDTDRDLHSVRALRATAAGDALGRSAGAAAAGARRPAPVAARGRSGYRGGGRAADELSDRERERRPGRAGPPPGPGAAAVPRSAAGAGPAGRRRGAACRGLHAAAGPAWPGAPAVDRRRPGLAAHAAAGA